MPPACSRRSLLLASLALTPCAALCATPDRAYDPLRLGATKLAQTLELVARDTARQRDIPLLAYLPNTPGPAPLVLFSHGLGGSRYGSAFLGQHWAARGYVALFVQHPGSDDGVWKDVPPAARMAALRRAANLQNTVLRLQDVPTVLDQMARWNDDGDHLLGGRVDMLRVGMSGHSFGAVTTQAVSGQRDASGKQPFTDTRIRAAAVMSPDSPQGSATAALAFAAVGVPWLLMTGTRDTSFVGTATVASRLAVFPALPNSGKYELVLDQAEHSVFTDRALPGDREKRNPNHHRAILAISTAFWDAWLRDDASARAWLDGYGPSNVLEPADRWQKK